MFDSNSPKFVYKVKKSLSKEKQGSSSSTCSKSENKSTQKISKESKHNVTKKYTEK